MNRVNLVWVLILTALAAVRKHVLRSALIVLTVAIGISAVTATVSLTDGVQALVRRNSAKAGRAVSVVHKDPFLAAAVLLGGRPPETRLELDYADLERITRDLPTVAVGRDAEGGLRERRPVTFIPAEIGYAAIGSGDGSTAKSVLVGTIPAYRVTVSYGLVAGRHLSRHDVEGARPVCVLDGGRARELWGAKVDLETCIGRRVDVDYRSASLQLEVVGVLEEPFLLRERFKAFDTVHHARPAIFERLNLMNLYVPITLVTARPRPGQESVSIGGVEFIAHDSATALLIYFGDCSNDDIKAYENEISEWAKRREQALFVLPQWYWLGLIGEMADDADIVGSLIWIVILFVTIIMILIVNLVVTRERYREVAIRRTEGARRSDIILQFVVESCMLSLVGGVLGLAGGVAGAWALSKYVTYWEPEFSTGGFAGAVLASLAIGILSTALPAWQAARLDPVKVLARP